MIVISRKRFVISLGSILLLTGFLVGIGMDLQQGDPVELKIDVENLLFWGIITLLLQFWIGLSLLARHKNLVNELNRIARIEDITLPHAEKIFNQMGTLGTGIRDLIIDRNRLLVMRSNRISALNALMKTLFSGYCDPIAVTDVAGAVLGISTVLEEKLLKERGGTTWENILQIKPDLNLAEIMTHMEKQRAPWGNPEENGIVCTPVFDKSNTLHFCIWEFESSRFTRILTTSGVERISKKTRGRLQGLMKKIAGGSKRKSPPQKEP